nr:unnamed protein product [Callosobruchus chinensis]CAH7725164.1 unnamed protein product [Callosobruchus chinensis]CAH7734591.1 unnamed protein product [Callosobruchus chinensis]CAH7735194.1 unnamed protein product [Callosobruchus chinensis]
MAINFSEMIALTPEVVES